MFQFLRGVGKCGENWIAPSLLSGSSILNDYPVEVDLPELASVRTDPECFRHEIQFSSPLDILAYWSRGRCIHMADGRCFIKDHAIGILPCASPSSTGLSRLPYNLLIETVLF